MTKETTMDIRENFYSKLQQVREDFSHKDEGFGTRLGQIETWKYGIAAIITFLLFLIANNAINLTKLFD